MECPKCGARRVDRMIGLEPTLQEWLDRMVAVCREIRRVLRPDGTFWCNLGDAYNGSPPRVAYGDQADNSVIETERAHLRPSQDGLKAKDLLMMPARLALALQSDGWWVRSDIIWSKPNPMPESVTDRPTSAHEHIYLLTRAARYYYDADAVREPHKPDSLIAYERDFNRHKVSDTGLVRADAYQTVHGNPAGRNIRDVWTMATQPYPEAHFATFPTELPRKCIQAGTSERGCCPECGAPWERQVDVEYTDAGGRGVAEKTLSEDAVAGGQAPGPQGFKHGRADKQTRTLGWQPSCDCKHHPTDGPMVPYDPIPCTVLDPFAGSGTTLYVARTLGRRAVGIELSPDYCQLALRRLDQQFLF